MKIQVNKKYFFIGACLCALGAAFVMYEGYTKALTLTEVVVAKQKIDARTVLTADMFETKSIPEMAKHPNGLTSEKISKVVGLTSVATIYKGQEVLGQAVGVEDEDGKQLVTKNDNTREFPIALDQGNVQVGNVKKGDIVDIIVNFKKEGGLGIATTINVAPLVEVVDVSSGSNGKQSLTVLVVPQEAGYISFAVEQGASIRINKAQAGSRKVQEANVLPQTFLSRFGFIVQSQPGR
ncbi:SAF domain-containing protein [Anaeromusa acidaminophila]|uniref:SAF domain-containing protein n=1 Tax=Anaeromusa acidaminophila TaxID=81464 RepID=UPI00035EFB1B|nr:SAF domain-containing protein [Anaeromusa acidaminophila]